MREYLAVIAVVVLTVLIVFWVVHTRTAQAPGPVACTMEAKLCPDGSAVGRTGPNCEFALCPTVATTTSGGGTVPSRHSGVRGTVMLGPTCPVMRDPPDPNCADKGYATTVLAYYDFGYSSAPGIGKSNASGVFQFDLPPGSYTLVAGGGQTFPRCSPVDVTVPASGYVTTTISCDTGIR